MLDVQHISFDGMGYCAGFPYTVFRGVETTQLGQRNAADMFRFDVFPAELCPASPRTPKGSIIQRDSWWIPWFSHVSYGARS